MAASSVPSRSSYTTDLIAAQSSSLEPILPAPNLAGRHEKHPRHEIVNTIFYVLRTGCAWRHLPHDLPPWQIIALARGTRIGAQSQQPIASSRYEVADELGVLRHAGHQAPLGQRVARLGVRRCGPSLGRHRCDEGQVG